MQYDVAVHKSTVTLADGESVGLFTSRLSEAVRKYATLKLNIASGKGGAWLTEVYADHLILDTWKRKGDNEPSEYKYFSLKYERDEAGVFKFSNFVEVERVTSFQPKQQLSITKSVQPAGVPGWRPLWAGAV